jgi:hypothetical protein
MVPVTVHMSVRRCWARMQVCLLKFDQTADFLLRQTEGRGDEPNSISDNRRLLRLVGCVETDLQEDGDDDDELRHSVTLRP